MVWTGAAMVIWLVAGIAACTVPLTPRQAQTLRWGLVAAGVPLLGLVTLQLGPLSGLAGLALGTAVLALHGAPARLRPSGAK